MYEQEDSMPKAGGLSVMNLCDALEGRVDTAHKALTELEVRISPILHQESTMETINAVPMSRTGDDSAVVLQRLNSIELRLVDLIEKIHKIEQRAEV